MKRLLPYVRALFLRQSPPPDPQTCVERLPTGTLILGLDLPRVPNQVQKLPDANTSGYRLRLWLRRDEAVEVAAVLREAAWKLEREC